jgi:hypothetical protein
VRLDRRTFGEWKKGSGPQLISLAQ